MKQPPDVSADVASGGRESAADTGRLSRRELLQGAAGMGLALGAGGFLAACGGGGGSSTTAAAGKPVRGGTLRVGIVSGGTAETLNPATGITPIDQSRIQNLYDPLVVVNPDLTTSPGLALKWTPNKAATEYEVTLRPGVTSHNGKTLSAQDVIYSIRLMAKPTSAAAPFV